MNKIHSKQGFTIIETLVAISVLMIAVAGPLVVASKGLFGANVAKNQMIANYLAQESMEVVKNTRDNNLDQNAADWLSGLRNCRKNQPCDASALDGAGIPYTPSVLLNCPSNLCPIYRQDKGYSHVAAGGMTTVFRRGFYIHNPANTGNCASDDECSVTVDVTWTERTAEYSISLTSALTSILR